MTALTLYEALDTVSREQVAFLRPSLGLSTRENQVLHLSAIGHTITEIAQKLTLSIKTVSTYKARIKQKCRIKTSIEWMTLLRDGVAVPRAQSAPRAVIT